MTEHAVGTREFFDDLDDYRFDKLHYLPQIVDFDGFRGQALLEVGCGIGIDLLRFARGGARVTGVDLSDDGDRPGDAELRAARRCTARPTCGSPTAKSLPFPDASFDVVYAHGVVQYTADPQRLVHEAWRVLKPGGQGIFMVYNRISWLNAMSMVMGVGLEHEDAPVLRKYSIGEFRALLRAVPRDVGSSRSAFPVKSRLHGGVKGWLYNTAFVGAFNALPRPLVSRFGWHLMGLCRK